MSKIKSALLVTFDFTQRGKSGTGFAAGSLISACKAHVEYAKKFKIDHLAIPMTEKAGSQLSVVTIVDLINQMAPINELDSLVLACYVWSSDLVEPIIRMCRLQGFKGKVILGGYQINKKTCKHLYPSGDFYIPGYAEASLPEAIIKERPFLSRIIETAVDFETLPSPYLDGSIVLERGQKMLHWETRRGCVFKCNFCAHRDLKDKGLHQLGMNKVKAELDLFRKMAVKKINVLDPIFNNEPNHVEILQYAIDIGLTALLSLQVRFERVSEEFLKLCAQLNVHLEFGLQTAVKSESVVIERGNSMGKVDKAIKLLQHWNQSFEVSLIYGLPGQTPTSFKYSINYLQERNVDEIKAFPLMVLEGTKLAEDKQLHRIVEGVIDESGIPHVVECYSFTRAEWNLMHIMANNLTISEAAS
ncbi:radical SAM protein [Shewanella sp. 1_MG-2023]|uniref:B12-binding domain-containing radical SAM protein n=1 Tax=unclassified Shewanella TaxID=196818 RepID=UPI0026E28116|nr:MULTISPECIES: radical SAM protein [unclassified Shewanella]MDO6611379.1 radical SAM protein [Shewanella sp. 7_MG-2023]MDO6771234.1 radical SAM protein [Shewanella sp. 2_MG-2023]MDO6795475.1 radical SAM protein [Shewanella sp. 1_MG-2023]